MLRREMRIAIVAAFGLAFLVFCIMPKTIPYRKNNVLKNRQ